MRDLDPGAMERWIGWSYTRSISLDLAAREKCENAEQTANHVQSLYITLAHDVKFSDRILDAEYQGHIVKAIIWVKTNMVYAPGPACASIIYSGTVDGHPARSLLTAMVATEGWDDTDWTQTWASFIRTYPTEMLSDIIVALFRSRPPGMFMTNPRSWGNEESPVEIEYRQGGKHRNIRTCIQEYEDHSRGQTDSGYDSSDPNTLSGGSR